jgi:putative nucleotidyltransferase with HDIG domain
VFKRKKRFGPEDEQDAARRRMKVLIWAIALMTALAVVATAVTWGYVVAVVCLMHILLFAAWREARLVERQRQIIQEKIDSIAGDYEAVIEALCGALDLRSNVEMTQSRRVAHLASVIAWQLGLTAESARVVRQAAILHDVGKLGIAESVLAKPGGLSEQELATMRRHPEAGYRILKDMELLREAGEIVRAHHERFDGQGYPRRLKGDQIPLAARIFAVADAYVAMTSDRPYRKKMPHDMAMKEIVRNTLTQFDPEVMEAFLQAERLGLLEEPAVSNGAFQEGPAPAGTLP